MKFLFKLAFWLSIVVLLLPADRAQQGPQVGTGEAMTAANAAVSDMRQFCARQPDACSVGSQALTHFGHKAQSGAKMLYEFLNEKFGREPSPDAGTLAGAGEKAIPAAARKRGQNTLTPADQALPWHGPQPRREAEARRPA